MAFDGANDLARSILANNAMRLQPRLFYLLDNRIGPYFNRHELHLVAILFLEIIHDDRNFITEYSTVEVVISQTGVLTRISIGI